MLSSPQDKDILSTKNEQVQYANVTICDTICKNQEQSHIFKNLDFWTYNGILGAYLKPSSIAVSSQ